MSSKAASKVYSFNNFRLDPEARLLTRQPGSEPVSITGKGFALLQMLVENHGKLLTKAELMEKVWQDSFVEEANLTQTVSVLRRILGDDPAEHRYILTETGKGYRFVAPVEETNETPDTEKENPEAGTKISETKAETSITEKPANFLEGEKVSPGVRSYRTLTVVSALILFAILLVGGYFEFPPAVTDWTKAKSIQLTTQAGSEIFPYLAPDGESFVFAAKNQTGFDIFLQRVGGKNALNLTKDSIEDDTHPAFSPDGKLIAFRSERNGGGIFLMEETGENPRRLSDFGFHPSWSPDGKQIAVSEKGFQRPSTRGKSGLWIINVENGEKRKLVENSAIQPAWSPGGQRIAFWFVQSGGRRDVATIPVNGGEPVPVTNSANTNWNPVWSPDGRYLYYSSDQSGNMAFWRVRIDQSTGEVLGQAEIVPTPAKFNSHLSFSKDGKRLIYAQTNNQSNIKAVKFDEKTGKTKGEPFWITRGDHEIGSSRLSPDGQQFVATLNRPTQEDIVLISSDGENWRDLTNDEYFDRYSRWSPDSKQIAFASDRSGAYEIWTINSDGTNLRQITFNHQTSTSFPTWSPDGRRIVYRVNLGSSHENRILDLTRDLINQAPQRLPIFEDMNYLVWDWSPDEKKLAGSWIDPKGNGGIGYLSLETNEYIKISNDNSKLPLWLSDSRRLIWTNGGVIYSADIDSKKIEKIFSLPEENINSAGIDQNNQILYFVASSSESNIWMLDLTQK